SSFRARRSYTLLERINARAFDLYHRNQDLEGVLSSLTYLTKHYASDGTFQADLESETFYFGSKAAMKVLFYEYECHLRSLRGETMDIPLSTWMSSDYQIDHIWAQAALSAGADYQEYLECGNKLGNLAVVPARTNIAMSNQNFSYKKNAYRESGLEALKGIAEAPHWRRHEIQKRTTELANFALRRWSLPKKALLQRIS
ncbi:MAG: HNH endonuclease family protein, partial [Thaumarchaeota archaeon]|nr:HNH endonuclease family protein [Nitrososphaerota archaeon]